MERQSPQPAVEASQKQNVSRLATFALAATLAATGGAVAGSEHAHAGHQQGGSHAEVDQAILDNAFGALHTEQYRLPHNQPTVRGSIDTRTMPEALPAAVQSLLPRVVKIKGEKATTQEGFVKGEAGSGLRLDQDTVLTARHVVADDSGKKSLLKPKTAVVDAMTNYHRGRSFNGRVKQADLGGEEKPINAVHAFSRYEGDVAVVDVRGLDPKSIENSQPVAIRDIAAQPINPGERLYTISFGDNVGGIKREPKQDEFMMVNGPNNISAEMLPGQSEPKVIGGIAIGGEDGIVVMPFKDYSAMPVPEQRDKPGDSGGALVDEQGRVVGVVSSLDTTKYTIPSDMLKAYTPKGAEPPTVEYIEPSPQYYAQEYAPVSPGVIRDLAAEAPAR